MKKLIIGIIASMSLTSCTAAKNIIQTPQTIKESISAKMQEEKKRLDDTIYVPKKGDIIPSREW